MVAGELLGRQPRAWSVLGKHSTTELRLQSLSNVIIRVNFKEMFSYTVVTGLCTGVFNRKWDVSAAEELA